MPGTPATTPRIKLPRYAGSDPADYPAQTNAIVDLLDPPSGLGGVPLSAQVVASQPVLDVGLANQIRAGRQLTVADFTSMGLAQPIGLWNLSNLTNLGSDGRALVNKGAVGFAPGINGAASTAAQFAGSGAQTLYIADSGAADPFRITTGSLGCWFRTAKRGTGQTLVSKWGASANYFMRVPTGNQLDAQIMIAPGSVPITGVSDVADDRWHFGVVVHDGTILRLYVDGIMEAAVTASGPIDASAGVVNIGSLSGDAGANGSQVHYGRVDEAFVSADVLTEDQVRSLYAAKLPHTLGVVPTGVRLNVRRNRKGAALATTDFSTGPLRLYNFVTGANFYKDEGSNNQSLTWQGGTFFDAVAGADGRALTALTIAGGSMGATDAGLPSGLAARSYGCWFKTTTAAGNFNVMAWGQTPGTTDARVWIQSGIASASSGADAVTGPFVADGQWHYVVVIEDNAAGDGVRRKLYVDGRLAGGSTVLNGITLGGANRFMIGANSTGGGPFTGQIDGVFVTGYAMSTDEVMRLYAKGSQALAPSPKNAGDHVEALTSDSVLFIGDTLESQHTIDLGVTV